MRKTHDLAVVTGSYQKDGATKNRYQNIGVVLEGERGPMILLDKHFNPAGIEGKDGRIVVSMFAVKDEYDQRETPRHNTSSKQESYSAGLDDEIPF